MSSCIANNYINNTHELRKNQNNCHPPNLFTSKSSMLNKKEHQNDEHQNYEI